MANLGDESKFWQKMASMPKIHQGCSQIFKWCDKKWHVYSWRFLQEWQIGEHNDFGKK